MKKDDITSISQAVIKMELITNSSKGNSSFD